MTYFPYLPPVTTFAEQTPQNNGVSPNNEIFQQIVNQSYASTALINPNTLAGRTLPAPIPHLPSLLPMPTFVLQNNQVPQAPSLQHNTIQVPLPTARPPKAITHAKPKTSAQVEIDQTILNMYKGLGENHRLIADNIDEIREKLNNKTKNKVIYKYLKEKGFSFTAETLGTKLREITSFKGYKRSRDSELADIKPKESTSLQKVRAKVPTKQISTMRTFVKELLYNYKLNNLDSYAQSNLKYADFKNCHEKNTRRFYKQYRNSGQEIEVFAASRSAQDLEQLFIILSED